MTEDRPPWMDAEGTGPPHVPRHALAPGPARPRWATVLAWTAGVALIASAMVATLAVVALPVLGRGAAISVPEPARPTNRPTGTAKPTGSAKPTSSPSATMPTDPKVLLKANPLYALKVSADCPDQRPPTSRTGFRNQVKALVKCENAAWKKALAKSPVPFAAPKVTFYTSATKSPCGRLGTTFPAAYCSTNRTLYFSTAAYAQGRYYRLAVAQFVMHEYAHHVQELAGIFSSSWVLDEKSSTTGRRIELQAHCMAHYQLVHSAIGFGSRDRADAEFQFSYTNDAAGHGSVKAERYWGRRGLAATTIGACNTWKVAASRVK